MSWRTTQANPDTIVSTYANSATIMSNVNGDTNTWTFDNTGNLTIPNSILAQNISSPAPVISGFGFIGQLTGSVSTTGNVFAGIVSASGNVTGTNFIGNVVATTVSASGNVIASNVIINGSTLLATGIINPDYINMTTSAASNVAASGTDLTWDVNNGSSGITYSAGKFSLGAGKTYHVLAEIAMQNFSTNGYLLVELVDGTTNARIGSQTLSIPYNTGFNEVNNPTLDIVYTPVANQDVKLRVTGGTGGLTAQLRSSGFTRMSIVQLNPTASLSAVSTISATGNVTANTFVGSGSGLTGVAQQTTGSWTVTAGTNTYSFTVPAGTWQMWVTGNIPNGIIAWNALATVTNTNVPVVGTQYAWVYNGGGTPLDFVSIPNQFTGTANAIVRSNVAPSSNTNTFTFSINNTSGNSAVVNYGYTAL
jgi:hypothetical protein